MIFHLIRNYTKYDICVSFPALLTDSIDEHVAACAKKKFDRYGFKGWPEWVKTCRLKPLPNIQEC